MGRIITRRSFLAGSAAMAASRPLWPSMAGAVQLLPPTGADAPFDHVVLLMMENRTFDHLLGWLPGADGRQEGLTFTDSQGSVYPTYELEPDFQGCSYEDPDHSFGGGLVHLDGGRGGGFLKTAEPGDTFPIGYYTARSRPVMSALATSYTVCDNYFSSVLGQTFPNRIYQQAARTDRERNTFDQSLLPTIWDRLDAAGLEGREYFHDLPTLGLWGATYASKFRRIEQFFVDAAVGDLPAYSLISPAALGEDQGTSNDDHPHGDLRAGDELYSSLYHALRDSPAWERTVFIINYDEWGGFYDHVIPPRAAADDSVVPGSTNDFHQMGFRVPCLVISPFAPAAVAHSGPYDHASVLKLVEWRFGLQPLAARDAAAPNLAEVLDLTSAPRDDRPDIPVLVGQPRAACTFLSEPGTRPAPVSLAPGATPATAPTTVPGTTPGTAPPTPTPGTTALVRTGLDLPVEVVGGGLLLGAWGLYHLRRTGQEGPLPRQPVPDDADPVDQSA